MTRSEAKKGKEMDEFIVWDDKIKKFLEPMTIEQLAISKPIKDKFTMVNWTICKYIGKKDINGKKIYADSSIVKVCDKNSKFDEDICKIIYCKNICAYLLCSLNFEDDHYEPIKADYRNTYYEVVGTIQESKLGLMK